MKKKFFILTPFLLTFSLLFCAIPSGAITLSLDNSGYNFGPGGNLRLSAGISNSGNSVTADVYLAIFLPDGAPIFFVLDANNNLTAVAGTSDPSSFRKLLSGATFAKGINTGMINLFNYAFQGSEPAGTYQTIFALTQPGTLNAVSYIAKSFFFSSLPVSGIIGTYSGSWTNQTYNTKGPATFKITDSSAGVLSITVTLGGNVFGGSAPPPFTVQANLNSQGATLSGGTTTFGIVQSSISANGTIQGTITSIPSNTGISSAGFSGTISNAAININYTINFTSGQNATGTLTATRQ